MKANNTQGVRIAARFRLPLLKLGYIGALATGIGLMATTGNVSAVTTQPILETSLEYEEVAGNLRTAPRKSFDFQKGSLRDILRFLADESGISFIALPESASESDDGGQLITFSINASPFSALETIARTHGIALVYEDGIFHMRPINDRQMIARTYQILHNTTETNTPSGSGSSTSSQPMSGGSRSGGGGSGGFGGGGGDGGSGSSGASGIGLNAPTQFTTNADGLVKDILDLIKIGTTGLDANIAGTAQVGNFSPLMVNPNGTVVQNNGGEVAMPNEIGGQNDAGHAIWNSDTNSLFVVATRQQHQYVESYLEMIDKPQPLIAVEVKFFETTKDPSRQLGVDWSGVMDGGYNVSLVNGLSDGNSVSETANSSLSTVLNLDKVSDWVAPQTAILSSDALSFQIQALLKDRETTTVSYPRVLTKNNRQVSIQSVVNQPVLAASSTTTPGVGGTSTASVEYIPIGTSIQVLPKHMSDGRIALQVLITISSIIGSEIIDGNPYPVASSRVFTAPLEVESGYTLAIGGLDEATDATEGSGLPLLGKAPILKRIFGNKNQSQSRKNLMIFITPTILDVRSGGLTDRPISEVPMRGTSRLAEPRVHEDGTLIGGLTGFTHAIAWLEEEYALVRNIVRETRGGDDDTREHITNLIRTTEILQKQAKDLKEAQPEETEELDSIIWTLKSIEEQFRNARWDARKGNIHLFSESGEKTEPF